MSNDGGSISVSVDDLHDQLLILLNDLAQKFESNETHV
jgi:hypothetical protein